MMNGLKHIEIKEESNMEEIIRDMIEKAIYYKETIDSTDEAY